MTKQEVSKQQLSDLYTRFTESDIENLRELRTALLELPSKELGHGALRDPDNQCMCGLGALARKRCTLSEAITRGLNQASRSYPEFFQTSSEFVAAVWNTNDLLGAKEDRKQRYARVLAWADQAIAAFEARGTQPAAVAHACHAPDPIVEAAKTAQRMPGIH